MNDLVCLRKPQYVAASRIIGTMHGSKILYHGLGSVYDIHSYVKAVLRGPAAELQAYRSTRRRNRTYYRSSRSIGSGCLVHGIWRHGHKTHRTLFFQF
jgi:hypothetical protein